MENVTALDQVALLTRLPSAGAPAPRPPVGMNDSISSFFWRTVDLNLGAVEFFQTTAATASRFSSASGSLEKSTTSPAGGCRTSSAPSGGRRSASQPVVVTLSNSEAQTVTASTTDTNVAGVSATYAREASVLVDDVGSKTTWSVTLKYEYTHSETKSRSETKTLALSVSETVNAPPMTSWTASLVVSIAKIPAIDYKTTAERWYDTPVVGGVTDPSNRNWYKRVEPVTVSVTGSLASSTTVNVKPTPLKS